VAAAASHARLPPAWPAVANCVVHWFEADCGAGGWLSTGPGRTAPGGAWVQSVELLEEPLELSALLTSAAGAAGGAAPRLTPLLAAAITVDRVALTAHAAVHEEE